MVDILFEPEDNIVSNAEGRAGFRTLEFIGRAGRIKPVSIC